MINNLTDNDLAKLVKNESNDDALSILISRHSGICYKIYNKYFYNNTSTLAKDVEQEKDLLIYKAAQSFDPSFGAKFSTWLGNIVTYACLSACNERKKECSFEEDIFKYISDQYSNEKSNNICENEELLLYIKKIIDMSSDEASKAVIKMRYFSEGNKTKTFKEIAEHFGVSTQTVVNWHDKFIYFLKNKLKSDSNIDIL